MDVGRSILGRGDSLSGLLVCASRNGGSSKSENGPEFIASGVGSWLKEDQVNVRYLLTQAVPGKTATMRGSMACFEMVV